MKKLIIDFIDEIPDNFTGIVIHRNTDQTEWYKNGKFHRVDGPSVIMGKDKFWHQYGKLHRLDGPAIKSTTLSESLYHIKGVEYSKKEFDRKTQLVKHQLPKRNTDFDHLTDDQWYEYLNVLVIE